MDVVKKIVRDNLRLVIDVIIVMLILKYSKYVYGGNQENSIFFNVIICLFIIIDLVFLYLKMTEFFRKKFELNESLLGRHLHFIVYAITLYVSGNNIYTNDTYSTNDFIDLGNTKTIIILLIIVLMILVVTIINYILNGKKSNTIGSEKASIKKQGNDVINEDAKEKKEYEYLKWIAWGMILIMLCILVVYLENSIDFDKLFDYNKIIDMALKVFLILVLIPIILITIMIVCSVIVMASYMIIDSVKSFKMNGKRPKTEETVSKSYLYLISAFIFIIVLIFVYQAMVVGVGDNFNDAIINNFQKYSIYIMGVILLTILLYFLLARFLISIAVDKSKNSIGSKINETVKQIGKDLLDYCKKLIKGPKDIVVLFSEMLVSLCELILDEDETNEEQEKDD